MLLLSGLMDVTAWYIHDSGIVAFELKTSLLFSISRIRAESISGKISFNFMDIFIYLLSMI